MCYWSLAKIVVPLSFLKEFQKITINLNPSIPWNLDWCRQFFIADFDGYVTVDIDMHTNDK